MRKSIIFLFSLLIISCTGTTEVKEPNMDYGGWSGVSDDSSVESNLTRELMDNYIANEFEKSGYMIADDGQFFFCLLYTSPSPRDLSTSRMPSSA